MISLPKTVWALSLSCVAALWPFGPALAADTLTDTQKASVAAGNGTSEEEVQYISECAMQTICRYSLIQSWSAQDGPNSMQYYFGSGEGASSNPILKGTEVGQTMAEIEAINRCNLNADCRRLLVMITATLKSVPPQVLEEAYNKGNPGVATTSSSTGAAPSAGAIALPAPTTDTWPDYDTEYSPENRVIVEFDEDAGLKVNGRDVVDPAGRIMRASTSNFRGVVTYASALGDGLISVDNLHVSDFAPREIATIRVSNWDSEARKVEVTTATGERISGSDFWLVPGGLWVVQDFIGETGFLYEPSSGITTVKVSDPHYVFSMIIGDPVGTGWILVGRKKASLTGKVTLEWMHIETGETFGTVQMFSPYDYGYKGTFQGQTELGIVGIVQHGGSSRVQYIDFDRRESKLLMRRPAGINEFNVHLLEDGDLGFDAWGGLSGTQEIPSMLDFVSNPAKYQDLKMIQLAEWGVSKN